MSSRLISALKELSKCIVFVAIVFICFLNDFIVRFSSDVCCVLFYRLVGGAADIKITKDGNTLLKEMVSFHF